MLVSFNNGELTCAPPGLINLIDGIRSYPLPELSTISCDTPSRVSSTIALIWAVVPSVSAGGSTTTVGGLFAE